ncbi:MAG: polysaccharide biosynthesis/export family protein [Bacteroidales bacterium]|nr:polysaccharide biosynthesis/export family protein [Bacteroidales bacterium]MCF8456361.1 polysaccharide biosynthesis/export family protein [Bacteroidales bacterium]
MKRHIYWLLFIVIVFASCRQNKELVYLQNQDGDKNTYISPTNLEEYKIQISDILYIKIFSLNKDLVDLFNAGGAESRTTVRYDQASMYFEGYMVNDSGYIAMPVLGDINVEGLNIKQVEEAVKLIALTYIKDVSVVVKLANFKITMIGEVKNPGLYYMYQRQTSILDAIGQAGDLTDYGNRKNILLIRPDKTGSTTYRINLADAELLSSDFFYLKPNDILYVEPMKSKGVRLLLSDYATILTAISSTLTAVVLVYTLVTL